MMDLSFIKSLIEAVDQSSIDSVDIERGGTRVRISKTPPVASGGAVVSQKWASFTIILRV